MLKLEGSLLNSLAFKGPCSLRGHHHSWVTRGFAVQNQPLGAVGRKLSCVAQDRHTRPSRTGWGCPKGGVGAAVAGMGWWRGIAPLSPCSVGHEPHWNRKKIHEIHFAGLGNLSGTLLHQVCSLPISASRFFLCPGSQQPPLDTQTSHM